LGVGATGPGHESQAHDGAAPPCQSIKCPYARVGAGVHAREASSEAEMDPRARRSPLEGGIDRATPLGRGGRLGVGRAVGVCLSERCVVFYFFAGFKRDSPGCFRGPPGLSPTVSP
jgi:hypothetical protein